MLWNLTEWRRRRALAEELDQLGTWAAVLTDRMDRLVQVHYHDPDGTCRYGVASTLFDPPRNIRGRLVIQ